MALTLVERRLVDVGVYDLAGRRVATLANGELPAGDNMLTWDGRDAQGGTVRGGMYFVRARGAGLNAVRRVLLLN